MTPKLLKDVSASTLQVIINQALGLVVFILTSLYLPKEIYGELNWSTAVLIFATTVLSLRLEQIVVRKSAAEHDPSRIMTLYMVHVLLSGVGFYLLLLVFSYLFPSFFTVHKFLLILGISQLFNFFALPFKQVANGKERFDYLAIMSSTANLVRSIGLSIMIIFFELNIEWVMTIFIISSIIEFLVCFLLVHSFMRIKLTSHIRFTDYVRLLSESMPQIGAAILIAGISRMDWILLGFFSTKNITAEYSFAYRVFEISPFPLLIIAPVLLSRFAKFFSGPGNTEQSFLLQKKKKLSLLIRGEMMAATLIPLVLNIIWTPFVDSITGNKYGAVNQTTFLILSCCIPFQYISNILWSAHFAQNRLKLILRITFFSFCIILAGDLVFIPLYHAKGAALVYLAAILLEYILYMRSSALSGIKETWQSLFICFISAFVIGLSAFYLFDRTVLRLAFAIPSFFLVSLATRQWQISDIVFVIQSVRKKKQLT